MWLSFSPAKNNLEAGAKSVSSGVPPATTSSAEMELYASNVAKLRAAGRSASSGFSVGMRVGVRVGYSRVRVGSNGYLPPPVCILGLRVGVRVGVRLEHEATGTTSTGTLVG